MRIWLVQPSEQLPTSTDVRKLRTRILAEELASRGHEVVWWASCFNHLRKTWYFDKDTTFSPIRGVTIHALKGLGYRRNVTLWRWFDHRMLNRKFQHMAKSAPKPDIVITSLPPHDLAASAVAHAKSCGATSIVDIRDKWPDNLVDVLPKPLQLLARGALCCDFAARNRALQGADVLLSMTEPLIEWGLARARRARGPADRVFYLGAYREQSVAAPAHVEQLVREKLCGRFVVTFIGTFSTYHNPEAMIDAARLLRHRSDIAFVLVGEGDLGNDIRRRAADLPNIAFTGWLESPAIAFMLQHSHLGLCTSGKQSERNFLPNKVFAYLAEGVPIGSVFDGELRELIEREGVGFNFNIPTDLASSIELLASKPAKQAGMAKAARAFFDTHCEAGEIYKRYADLVERLVQDKSLKDAKPLSLTPHGDPVS